MTLLFADGFDGYTTGGNRTVLDPVYDYNVLTGTSEAGVVAGGRIQDKCSFLEDGNGVTSNLLGHHLDLTSLSTSSTWIVGFAMYIDGANLVNDIQGVSRRGVLQFLDSANSAMATIYVASGNFSAVRGSIVSTAKLAAGTARIFTKVWHYVECKITFSLTSGTVSVRVDDQAVLSGSGATTATATSEIVPSTLVIGSSGNFTRVLIDDLYVCDSAGTANNDFLGDIGVRRLDANGNGATNDFTAAGGGLNYTKVNEDDPDSDTSYNSSGTSGHKDLYDIENISYTPAAINALQVVATGKSDDGGLITGANLIRSGSSEETGTSYSLTSIYKSFSSLHPTNPATGTAWTASTINSAQIGVTIPAGAATGTTYYVNRGSGSASDSNPGTAALPWLTIRKAANTVVAGDTVIVKAGTYTETSGSDAWNVPTLAPTNSGTAALPITFQAAPGEAVTITNDSGSGNFLPGAIGVRDKNYIVWDGFTTNKTVTIWGATGCTVKNCDINLGFYSNNLNNHDGVRIENCTDFRLQFCRIRNVTGTDANATGIKVYTSQNNIIEDCYIHDCTTGIYDKDSNNPSTYRRNLIESLFLGNNQIATGRTDAVFYIYDNVFNGTYCDLFWLNTASEVHDNLFLDVPLNGALGVAPCIWTRTTTPDSVDDLEVWNNVVRVTGTPWRTWHQYWDRTSGQWSYFNNNVYTGTASYRFGSVTANLATVQGYGFETNTSQGITFSNIYNGSWVLQAPYTTFGRYSDPVGPGTGSDGLIATILDTTRYGP